MDKIVHICFLIMKYFNKIQTSVQEKMGSAPFSMPDSNSKQCRLLDAHFCTLGEIQYKCAFFRNLHYDFRVAIFFSFQMHFSSQCTQSQLLFIHEKTRRETAMPKKPSYHLQLAGTIRTFCTECQNRAGEDMKFSLLFYLSEPIWEIRLLFCYL